jgi:hypothetical protein
VTRNGISPPILPTRVFEPFSGETAIVSFLPAARPSRGDFVMCHTRFAARFMLLALFNVDLPKFSQQLPATLQDSSHLRAVARPRGMLARRLHVERATHRDVFGAGP